MRRPRPTLALLAAVAALTGCGLGPGESAPAATGASISVTRGFGDRQVGRAETRRLPRDETVMRMLQRSFDVRTRYGGGFVHAINGVEGGSGESGREDWFFYVNGIEAEEGAAAFQVEDGDRVQWDFHPWEAAQQIPAIVGAFPEPFRSGTAGKRIPVRIDCAPSAESQCDAVAERLLEVGVTSSRAVVGQAAGLEVLRVVVGPWREIRRDGVVARLELGPEASGVFARPASDGATIALLDERAQPERRAGAGTGLIAATRYAEQQPAWAITGTDAAGVRAAVGALREAVLADRFAVAVEGGRPVPLPVTPEA